MPKNVREQYDVREIIARSSTARILTNLKRCTDKPVAALPVFMYPVGIVANNGVLFAESAQKGAHFIELCAQRKIIDILQNITGFMVGKQYETGGIAKHGAKMVTAVACAVPKLTLIVGNSMALQLRHVRQSHDPNFLFMGPSADLRHGRRAAAGVLAQVRRGQIEASGRLVAKRKRP